MAEVLGLETLVNPCGRKDDATWHRATTASSRDRKPLQQQAVYAHAQCSPAVIARRKASKGEKGVLLGAGSLVRSKWPLAGFAFRGSIYRAKWQGCAKCQDPTGQSVHHSPLERRRL